jgi:hypothetical protein
VTQKTGNFKKFNVFVRMLATALKRDQKSEVVFADLLTYADLEMLRSRQTRKPLNTAARPNNKRYLILTYAVEFDRVHYPLPLSHVDEPPVHALNATIRRSVAVGYDACIDMPCVCACEWFLILGQHLLPSPKLSVFAQVDRTDSHADLQIASAHGATRPLNAPQTTKWSHVQSAGGN